MDFRIRQKGFEKANGDLLVCFVRPGARRPEGMADSAQRRALARALTDTGFRATHGDTLTWNVGKGGDARRYLLVGLGPERRHAAEVVRHGAARAAREAGRLRAGTVAVAVPDATDGSDAGETLRAVLEGLARGGYEFDRHLTDADRKPDRVRRVDVYVGASRPSPARMRRVRAQIDAIDLARDLVNEPPSRLTPQEFARRAARLAKSNGLTCRTLGPTELKKLGMKAMLQVARGSAEPARLVHLTYRPKSRARGRKRVVLVGKGVTFDSGGLNLKPTPYMATMKCDMGGAAAVVAAMSALAASDCRHEVHGVVGLVENMTGADAYKPGDILDTYLGKTVEVGNTDAEGRLVLCDLLAWCGATMKPDVIVDVATLTGAVVVALGPEASGLFTDDDGLREGLLAAAEAAGEKVWPLPLYRDYLRMLQHGPADLNNVGGRYGGAITAGLFLREFVPDGVPWAHLDIAGPAFYEKKQPDRAEGGSGAAVPTLLRWLEAL